MRRFRDPRTGPFDAAIKTGRSDDAVEILKHRHSYWSGLIEENQRQSTDTADQDEIGIKEAFSFVTEGFGCLAVIAALLGFTAITTILLSVALIALIPVGLILFAGWAAMTARSVSMFRRSFRSYSSQVKGLCLECGYDNSGCDDAIQAEIDHGSGPELCPECATRWPGIPAATPQEMHRWHKAWFRR